VSRYEDFIWVGDGVSANAKEQIGKRYYSKGKRGTVVSATDLCVTVRWDSVWDSFGEKLEKGRISGWELLAALLIWVGFEYTIRTCSFFGKAQYHFESMAMIWLLLFYFCDYKKCAWLVPALPNFRTFANILPFYGALAFVLIPIGIRTGFLHFDPDFSRVLYVFLMYFIFVATVEEIMWRGVVQKFFSQYFKSVTTIVITSVMFGLIHIHKGGTFPNYSYVLLATIAGTAYGYVFKKYGLRESILLHTLVDTTWHSFFR